MVWEVFGTSKIFWDFFGAVLGDWFWECWTDRMILGHVWDVCLGCFWDMFVIFFPSLNTFPNFAVVGTLPINSYFGRPFGTWVGLPQHLWEVFFLGTQLGCVWELRLGGLFGKVPYFILSRHGWEVHGTYMHMHTYVREVCFGRFPTWVIWETHLGSSGAMFESMHSSAASICSNTFVYMRHPMAYPSKINFYVGYTHCTCAHTH